VKSSNRTGRKEERIGKENPKGIKAQQRKFEKNNEKEKKEALYYRFNKPMSNPSSPIPPSHHTDIHLLFFPPLASGFILVVQ